MSEFESLENVLSDTARVSRASSDRAIYSRDCWPYLTLNARAGRASMFPPDVVVFPSSEADIVETVRWCHEKRIPLVPVGGGSGVCGSSVPLQGGVAVDAKCLTGLDTSQGEQGLAWIGAGWNGSRLEHELNRRGLTLGHFPSSLGCSTLGGYLATRSAGQLSTRHGKIEDLVLSVDYLDHRGDRRNSEGEGDTQIIVGSEGTLAFILGALMRVERAPVHRRYHGYLAEDVPTALAAMQDSLQRGLRPSVLRL
ncbi:MAG: alkyldihydroxyacetonephosphate synthase, partial [Bradymonadia bacterium]